MYLKVFCEDWAGCACWVDLVVGGLDRLNLG